MAELVKEYKGFNIYTAAFNNHEFFSSPKDSYHHYLNKDLVLRNATEFHDPERNSYTKTIQEQEDLIDAYLNKIKEEEDMSNRGFYVDTINQEISTSIQKEAFKNGYLWAGGQTTPIHSQKYLFFYMNRITHSTSCSSYDLVSIEEAFKRLNNNNNVMKVGDYTAEFDPDNKVLSVEDEVELTELDINRIYDFWRGTISVQGFEVTRTADNGLKFGCTTLSAKQVQNLYNLFS